MMQSEESDSNSSTTLDIPDSFKYPQISQVWRPHACYHISNLLRHKTYAQKIRKRRKPVLIRYKPNQKVPHYDHPMPVHNASKSNASNPYSSEDNVSQNRKFNQREITTIHEEVFQCSKAYRNRISKARGYKEKVASLKAIVGRLQKMCLEKPEVLQNNIPDETIRLFKAIHI